MLQKKVRWGIAGLGNIAHRFASDLTGYVENGELYAVAARDATKAKQFAGLYRCRLSYGSYQALADNPEIDAIYIATIHPYHVRLAELFLSHGKHVLVEKPAFTNLNDWDAMNRLASQNHCLLLEAMKTVTFPAYRELRKVIKAHSLPINRIEAAFGGITPFDPKDRLFDPQLSGGATLDVGVYGLWLYADLCHLVGQDITQPAFSHTPGHPDCKVDETVLFHFDGHAGPEGDIGASLSQDLPRYAKITGPDLDITIQEKWWNPQHINIIYRGKHHNIHIPSIGGGFEHEILHFSSLVLEHKTASDQIPHSVSRQVIQIMEQALSENEFGYLTQPGRR